VTVDHVRDSCKSVSGLVCSPMKLLDPVFLRIAYLDTHQQIAIPQAGGRLDTVRVVLHIILLARGTVFE
jgi:hypothetical protein